MLPVSISLSPELTLRDFLARLGSGPVTLPRATPAPGAWRVGRAAGLLVGARVRDAR
jgi:hypothetical protein